MDAVASLQVSSDGNEVKPRSLWHFAAIPAFRCSYRGREQSPTVEMELFAGFNAEELAMMQELLRLLLEDDDVQPAPRQDSFEPKLAGGMGSDFGDYPWGVSVPNGMAWNAPPAMMAPTPQYATKASRTRTRSNFGSDEEPMLKRGRVDVAPTMRAPVNCIPVPEGSHVGYPYY